MRLRHVLCVALIMAAGVAPGMTQTGLYNRKSMPDLGEPAGEPAGPGSLGAVGKDDLAGALNRLSRIANTPFSDSGLNTRGVADASLYKAASPSVVLIVTEDGLGSGTLIDSSGLILTNWHVVGDAKEVGVVFKPAVEGQEPSPENVVRAKVQRIDEVADLALVKVDQVPAGHNPIALGSPDEIQIGLDVYAIGHPNGAAWTYTKGIISQFRAKYEWEYEEDGKHQADVIQTQTPINPGNSGGPLLSTKGTLIGVSSFGGEGEGLNFAVSVNDVRKLLTLSQNRLMERTRQADACAFKLVGKGRLEDGSGQYEQYNVECVGKARAVLIIPNDASEPFEMILDSNADQEIDGWVYDDGRDKKWDFSVWDTDYDGKPDLVGHHPDGAFKPSKFESYAAYEKRIAAEKDR